MPTIKTGFTKSTKGIGKQVGKQVVHEPFEILKTAGRQVRGTEIPTAREEKRIPEITNKEELQVKEAKLKAQGKRQVAALERELTDIKKIKRGEGEKKRQEEEAIKREKEEEKKEVPHVKPKRGRRLLGWAKKLVDIARRTEVRQPPTG